MTAEISNSSDNPDFKNVLLCCTGSVATIKVPELVDSLSEFVNVRLVSTEHAQHFLPAAETLRAQHFRDADEWSAWQVRGDPVLHIELRRWADLLLIAPLDANTMSKLAHGLCDNLLTCVVRAWDVRRPLLFAPAMNTHMWEHPLTASQLLTLQGFGYEYIPVVEKLLMCGDKGLGAMASVADIVSTVRARLVNDQEKDERKLGNLKRKFDQKD